MIGRLVRYWQGKVRFEAQGGRYEQLLNCCAQQGIVLEHIVPTPTGFSASAGLRDYKKLHRHARRARCRLRVKEKYGAYFALRPLRRRFGIPAGIAAALMCLLLGRSLIWNISFPGFTPEQEAAVRTQLFERGIYEGALHDRQKLLCAAGEIFESTQEYGWVRFNFVKGRLVAEKTDRLPTPELIGRDYTDIVALCGGIVRKVEPHGGFVCARPGQYVSQGQTLVQGLRIGEYGKTDFTHAEAYVTAEVERTYTCTQPLEITVEKPTGNVRRYYTLWTAWGPLRLHGRIDVPDNAQQKEFYEPAAPFGFHLPLTVQCTQVREKEQTVSYMTPQLARDTAYSRIMDAMQREFGSFEIIDRHADVKQTDADVTLTLRVRFLADIGKIVPGAPYDAQKAEKERKNEWE